MSVSNDAIAKRVAARLPEERWAENVKFDPMTILMILSALLQLYRLWQDCKVKKAINKMFGGVESRSVGSLRAVKRIVKRKCPREYSEEQIDDIVHAIFDEANAVGAEEIDRLAAMSGV